MNSPRRGSNRWSISGSVPRSSCSNRWAWPPAAPHRGDGPALAYGGSLSALNSLEYHDAQAVADDFGWPQTEEELALHYQQKIMDNQQRFLEPLREDLADWINRTLGLDYVTSENIFDMLDTGVLLCHLATMIQTKAQSILQGENGLQGDEVDNGAQTSSLIEAAKRAPVPKIRCWERAAKGSFFSRENACNFLKFCRDIGIHEHLLFESEDLVIHTHPRNVILCLLEVGRYAAALDMDPPGLVQLEREVDLQIEQYQCGLEPNSSMPTPSRSNSSLTEYAQMNRSITFLKIDDGESRQSTSPLEDTVPLIIQPKESKGQTTELDKKVEQLALATQAECRCVEKYCEKLSIFKISEGVYRIADRNIFIRLFKDRHVMVRVGGGWDTLEHYLLRHDPCRKADAHSSRCTTPDTARAKPISPSGAVLATRSTLHASSTPCLNDNKLSEPGQVASAVSKTTRTVNPQRKYVARSMTLDLNQEARSSAYCTPKRTTSFIGRAKSATGTTPKDGVGASDPVVPSHKVPGFSFARASVERNASFSTPGKRNRPASAVYYRSKAADLNVTPLRPGRP